MFTAPLASLTGWSWSHTVATDLPAALRLAFPPSGPGTAGTGPAAEQPALSGCGPATALRFPATGRWRHAQSPGSDVHWIWGAAADVLLHGGMRTRLTSGNPILALRFTDPAVATADNGDPKGVALGDPVRLGGDPISTAQLTMLAAAPGRPGLDTLGVLRYVAAALAAECLSAGSPSWADFATALAGLEQPLRILEPGGSPATGRTIHLVGGGTENLDATHRGDALVALGLTRAALAGATLDVGNGHAVVASAAGTPYPDGLVALSPASDTVQVAALDEWFAPQQAPALTRYTRGNVVRPFVDGVDTFADLFTELNRAVAAGPLGAFYVTGYSLEHKPKLGPAGTDTPLRTVAEVAEAMAAAGGDPRFLALQMLQFNPGWVQDVQTLAYLVALLLATTGIVATGFQDRADQATIQAYTWVITSGLFAGIAHLDAVLESFELNRGSIDALAAIDGVEAHLDPVDAEVGDNPVGQPGNWLVAQVVAATRKFAVFHQKIQVVRNANGIHAYCGGIDLHASRTQNGTHASRFPFHDVHARVNGEAAGELVTTFIERWQRASATRLALDTPGALHGLPVTGPDVVQVARTYYRSAAGSGRGLLFAPRGENTILETLIQAIGRARRYIYVEDQYLTPPPRYRDALAAAAARVSGPLIIVIPSSPDQPFGFPRRQRFIADMRAAWGDRFKIGYLRKRFSHTPTTRESAVGRVWLAGPLDETADIVELGPAERVPAVPFWLTVGGEVMRAYQQVADATNPATVRLHVERAETSRLFSATQGTPRKTHQKGAAASTGSFPAIYVHAKLMLIDDAFASISSANANRRSYYSDGECSLFALRETVADGADNWIRGLRLALWAEHLGVAPEYARTALRDPAAGLALFDRAFTVGNRFSAFDAQPYTTEFTLAAEITESTSPFYKVVAAATVAAGAAEAVAGANSDAVFDTVVDPSSFLET